MQTPSIFVMGASGTIGSRLVAELKSRQANFRIGSTRAGTSVEGVTAVQVDYSDPGSLERAFQGTDVLFILTPLAAPMVEWTQNAVRAAQRAGVRHVVRSSGAGADPNSDFLIARVQGQADQAVIDSGLNYTLLRPNCFMQNFVTFSAQGIKEGQHYHAHGDGHISFIDARDIAEIAASILVRPEAHNGKTYTLTGNEALTNDEALAQINRAAGTHASAVSVTLEQAHAGMKQWGFDDFTAEAITSLNRIIQAGYAAGIAPDAAQLLGHAPHGFAQFARDHANAWKNDASPAL